MVKKWSISPTGELFALQNLHNYGEREAKLTLEDFNPSKVCDTISLWASSLLTN